MTDETYRARVMEVLRPTANEWDDWHWQFRHRITSMEQLGRFVDLPVGQSAALKMVEEEFPLSITPYYLSLARLNDPNDPILLQSVPSEAEFQYADMGEPDPLMEMADSPVPGLVHRYPDRALLVLTDICPVLCRHCTRKREWAGGNWIRQRQAIEAAVDYLRRTPAIRDVIISGGDPLTLDNQKLEEILALLRSVPHLEILRFGTRYPVVLPQRIDEGFARICDQYGPIWLNTHFNHPHEVTPEATRAVRELLRAGVPVNNQTVLMRGINDSLTVQRELSHALLKARVRPYYLFHGDEVRGTEHLRTPVEVGIEIIEGLRGHTSGLGVPTYVVDVAGGGGKIPLQPQYLLGQEDGMLLLRNYEGQTFRYRNPSPVTRHPSRSTLR